MTLSLRNITAPIIPMRLAGALALAASVATFAAPSPAFAQDGEAEARIRKIEAEVRALQRKVFPGGDGRYFEPQIAPGTAAQPAIGAQPSPAEATAVTDILVRLDALETQLRTLTARSEEQANALSQMEMRLAALETATNAPLAAPMNPMATGQTASALPAPSTAAQPLASAPRPVPTQAPAPAPTVAAPSPARLAAVQAITKPQTADAGDDEYSYGFRLWNAGFYPEARQQLTRFVEQYPSHSRISFGRNLLGRAFLDDNMPDEAARWFLKNYQANKAGDRAPDSLLYLGKAMIALNDTRKACIALAEFGETYPLVATGRLADDYRVSLNQVTCN
ncbi:tetratricopeptide repeat protein [Erythrobacter sp. R86502]|uniref:tetratricopeptide repeat protein n=1 Tax=Erythrobacter sp. R86502 TaxID=3093846 RepID=UPI0036D3EBC8